jgi:cephalosporin hydroxylase
LNYINYIRNSSIENLKDDRKIEQLLLQLGINDEVLSEIPEELHSYCGFGLKFWQYPNQFSKYLHFLTQYNIKSYLEIGVRYGGTFITTIEYLSKFNTLNEAVCIDISKNKSLQKYCKQFPVSKFYKVDSTSKRFFRLIKDKIFDLVLIDGNHDENYCRQDFMLFKSKSNIIVLHDIISDACPGVQNVWREINIKYKDEFSFYEFTEQYSSVYQKAGNRYFGIGVAVRNHWIAY